MMPSDEMFNQRLPFLVQAIPWPYFFPMYPVWYLSLNCNTTASRSDCYHISTCWSKQVYRICNDGYTSKVLHCQSSPLGTSWGAFMLPEALILPAQVLTCDNKLNWTEPAIYLPFHLFIYPQHSFESPHPPQSELFKESNGRKKSIDFHNKTSFLGMCSVCVLVNMFAWVYLNVKIK